MVAERRLNDDGKGGFQSVAFQPPSSDRSVNLIFLKENYARRSSNPEFKNQNESTLTIRPRGPLSDRRNISYMGRLCLNLYLELVFLIFSCFYNHHFLKDKFIQCFKWYLLNMPPEFKIKMYLFYIAYLNLCFYFS